MRVSDDLIRNAQLGNSEAFSELYEAYQEIILVYCKSLVRDKERAEELAQDTWVQALKSIGETGPDLKISGWLHRIAHNKCLDELRRRNRIGFVPLEFVDPETGSMEEPSVPETSPSLGILLATLPVAERNVLLLRFEDRLSLSEISRTLGLSLSNVRKLLRSGVAGAGALLKE